MLTLSILFKSLLFVITTFYASPNVETAQIEAPTFEKGFIIDCEWNDETTIPVTRDQCIQACNECTEAHQARLHAEFVEGYNNCTTDACRAAAEANWRLAAAWAEQQRQICLQGCYDCFG